MTGLGKGHIACDAEEMIRLPSGELVNGTVTNVTDHAVEMDNEAEVLRKPRVLRAHVRKRINWAKEWGRWVSLKTQLKRWGGKTLYDCTAVPDRYQATVELPALFQDMLFVGGIRPSKLQAEPSAARFALKHMAGEDKNKNNKNKK